MLHELQAFAGRGVANVDLLEFVVEDVTVGSSAKYLYAMESDNWLSELRTRVFVLAAALVGEKYWVTSCGARIDEERDRVEVEAGGSTITEFGEEHRNLSDGQLRAILSDALMKLGPGFPPRFREPEV